MQKFNNILVCWSNEEVARYLETYKAYEFKSAEAIMEKATITNNSNSNSTVNNSDANFVIIKLYKLNIRILNFFHQNRLIH
jgi:hypothetical protein